MVTTGAFASADGKSDQPQDGKHHRHDPQNMHGEAGAEEDEHEQKTQQENHARKFPNMGLHQTFRRE